MKVSDEIRAKGRDALCDMEIATGKIDDSARALIADAVIDAVKDDIVASHREQMFEEWEKLGRRVGKRRSAGPMQTPGSVHRRAP